MPSREQRVLVWKGELKKTSGGLTKDDLIKNKRGKLVSRRKSKQAADQNNLGDWLRSKGDKFKTKPKEKVKETEKPTKKKIKATKSKKAEVSVSNIVPKRKRKKVDYTKYY